jgi:hypothetical protein
LSAIAGYWLGARWFLVPLVVMGVEIVIAVPVTLLAPTGGETPISVVLEAPLQVEGGIAMPHTGILESAVLAATGCPGSRSEESSRRCRQPKDIARGYSDVRWHAQARAFRLAPFQGGTS